MSHRLHPDFSGANTLACRASSSLSHEVARASLIARIRAVWLDAASPQRDQQLSRALIDFCVDSPLPRTLGAVAPLAPRRVELERDTRQGWRLLAIVWGPGQHSSLHSHGGRPAHEGLWRGELSIEHFESTPLVDGRVLLCLLARDSLRHPDAQVSPRFHEDIHRCSNRGDELCVSLHLLPLQVPPQREFVLCSDGAFEIIDAGDEHFETLHA